MAAQKGGDGLGQLVLRVSGGGSPFGGNKQHQPQQVTFRQDGGRHGGGQLVVAVADRDGLAVPGVLVDPAALHDLLQLRRDPLAQQLPLAAAGHGDHRVPVRDGAHTAGGAAHSLAKLRSEVLHTTQQRVLLKDDLAVPAGVDLQRVALPDAHGAADLFGDDHPSQVVPLCQVGAKKFFKFFKKPTKTDG